MKFEITKTAVRTKEGKGWTAYFFKHRNNTVMVEEMWDSINPNSSVEDVISNLKDLQSGGGLVKRTATVSTLSPKIIEVIRNGNTLPSITINIKQ